MIIFKPNHNRIFPLSQCLGGYISRFGVIPKHHQINKWHLIIDLLHPLDHSVNYVIPKSLCGHIAMDDATLKYGLNTLLSKVHLKNAFQLIPDDRHLLAIRWHNQVYINGCLPFGLHLAPT